ncbi:LacI family DNA-binding transcriptional regulator [Halobacillus salinarum]|uniref:LacI family DNA-binding transcriptional regulator n=1 Tax=Halobacillus salinarum TaxID=2932257 RepID=A0ABY4EN95_9BACI|nr:LacI family DNA-binding transcriptional regulator [Halobacillus salinarum]UOQ45613.1 LacI family DNA-binding transcriptional regulator [Halobacillus salinarum]
MTTIKEIALKANYSNTTVSRVLNNDQTLSVSTEARNKILQVARELGYKTLQERKKEQKLSNSAPGKVGILLCHSVEEELNDAYFLSIRHGIENECEKRGLNSTEILRIKSFKEEQMSKDIEHLIVVGRISEEFLNPYKPQLKTIVYINHSVDDSLYDSIAIDFEKATKQALDHLLSLGYRRIGFVGGQEREHLPNGHVDFEDGRKTTFKQVLHEQGLFDPDAFYTGEFTMSDGYELMRKAIQKGDLPEAFFVASDAMAIGAIRALNEQNYRVPEDVAIVSFNDIESAQYTSPPLTTVRVRTEEMGKLGVKLMLDRLEGRDIPVKVTVPTELVVRESCGSKQKEKQNKHLA